MREKEGQYIMIKGSIQEEEIKNLNTYAPRIGAAQYIRLLLIAIEGKLTVTQEWETLKPHLQQWTDHPDKINKETQALNDTVDQIDLTDT